jgi:hypothetical protein
VFDDVLAVELRAVARVTYALVDKMFMPDGAADIRAGVEVHSEHEEPNGRGKKAAPPVVHTVNRINQAPPPRKCTCAAHADEDGR